MSGRSRAGRAWRRAACVGAALGRDSRGAAAVEFAIVCLPFFALLTLIVQISLYTWASRNLDDALQQASRVLYTGAFPKANASGSASDKLAKFKSALCGSDTNRTFTLFDCSGLRMNVVVSTSFASEPAPTPVDAQSKDWKSGFGSRYDCIKPGSIVVVTAAAKYPVLIGLFGQALSSFKDGAWLLQSTAVFRTEPYEAGTTSNC